MVMKSFADALSWRRGTAGLFLSVCACAAVPAEQPASQPVSHPEALPRQLKDCPYRIVYETHRDNNFELFIMNADGTNPVNVTKTPDVDELYPHASPDGTKICFVADEGKGDRRRRSVYYMNIDGSGRTKVAENANQPCWSPDGTTIAYLGGVPFPLASDQSANKGLYFYDLKTGKCTEHVNKDIQRLLCISWSPDGKWFAASAVGGLGYAHAIIVFEANGMRHFELCKRGNFDWQCRPDFGPDGKKLLYVKELGDLPEKCFGIVVEDIDLNAATPRMSHPRWVAKSPDPIETYQGDWSPDGRFVAYSRGPKVTNKMKPPAYIVGVEAKGWDIWVADANGTNNCVQLTHDGLSNKEPDWVFSKR